MRQEAKGEAGKLPGGMSTGFLLFPMGCIPSTYSLWGRSPIARPCRSPGWWHTRDAHLLAPCWCTRETIGCRT